MVLERLAAALFSLVLPLHAMAEPRPTVGMVFYRTPMQELSGPSPASPTARALVQGLREKGWIDGGNLRIVWKTGIAHPRGTTGAVEDLVRMKADVIVVSGNDIAVDAERLAPSIPVVMASSDFPVENGVVASYSRPGRNITGVTNWVGRGLNAKRLGLLKEAVPGITKVAFLAPPLPPSQTGSGFSSETRSAASALDLSLWHAPVNRLEDLDAVFERAVAEGANAIFVVDYPFAFVRSSQEAICRLSIRYRLPAIHSASTAAEAGAMLTYGPDITQNFRRAAHIVDKILRGAKAGEIPIEDPAKLELVVNLEAARAIDVPIPSSILTQATRVIGRLK